MAQHATPEAIEELTHGIEALNREVDMLQKEAESGHNDHADKLKDLKDQIKKLEGDLEHARTQWQEELGLVNKIRALEVSKIKAPKSVKPSVVTFKHFVKNWKTCKDVLHGSIVCR